MSVVNEWLKTANFNTYLGKSYIEVAKSGSQEKGEEDIRRTGKDSESTLSHLLDDACLPDMRSRQLIEVDNTTVHIPASILLSLGTARPTLVTRPLGSVWYCRRTVVVPSSLIISSQARLERKTSTCSLIRQYLIQHKGKQQDISGRTTCQKDTNEEEANKTEVYSREHRNIAYPRLVGCTGQDLGAKRTDVAEVIVFLRDRSIAAKQLTTHFIRCCTFGRALLEPLKADKIQMICFETKADGLCPSAIADDTCEASEVDVTPQSPSSVRDISVARESQPGRGEISCTSNGPRQTNHKKMNSHLLASQMDLLRDIVDLEIPVSEIRDDTYKLIDEFGFDNVTWTRCRTVINIYEIKEI
ncbi:hypothetical protein IW261DRAFT_1426861 [Armillaria novae-zelandiae]|uniref:Uncharacterized protein n=1 Tax=Armillaria novae-zelandiae TaxID=153914 RepID=A0AA39NJ34_9AGAR|nr:hypothetical protein IW261DRAFT_1426861 [Armillaria novae-zelandiae]